MEDGIVQTHDRLRMELSALRGLWPCFEADLRRLGYSSLSDLRGRDPESLTQDYCRLMGRPVDTVIRVTFEAAISFAETGAPVPWWRLLRAELAQDRARDIASVGAR